MLRLRMECGVTNDLQNPVFHSHQERARSIDVLHRVQGCGHFFAEGVLLLLVKTSSDLQVAKLSRSPERASEGVLNAFRGPVFFRTRLQKLSLANSTLCGAPKRVLAPDCHRPCCACCALRRQGCWSAVPSAEARVARAPLCFAYRQRCAPWPPCRRWRRGVKRFRQT